MRREDSDEALSLGEDGEREKEPVNTLTTSFGKGVSSRHGGYAPPRSPGYSRNIIEASDNQGFQKLEENNTTRPVLTLDVEEILRGSGMIDEASEMKEQQQNKTSIQIDKTSNGRNHSRKRKPPTQPRDSDAEEILDETPSTGSSRKSNSNEKDTNEEFANLLFRDEGLREQEILPFRFGIFMFEFWTTWLYPLSLPVVLATQGITAAQNKWYLPKPGSLSNFFVNFFGATPLTWGPQVMALIMWESWPIQVVIVCATFGLFRIIVVGGKYAGYTKQEYDAVMYDTGRDLWKQLLAVKWTTVEDPVILNELRHSEHATRISLKNHVLTLSNGTRVTAEKYLFTLLKKVFGSKPFDESLNLFRLNALILCGYPVWVYLEYIKVGTPEQLPVKAADIILIVFLSFQMLQHAPTVYNFMKIGLYHYRRHYIVAEALLNAVLPSHAVPSDVDDYMIQFAKARPQLQSVSVSRILPIPQPTTTTTTDNTTAHPSPTSGTREETYEEVEDSEPVSLTTQQMIEEEDYDANLVAWDAMRRVSREFGRSQAHRIAFNTFATACVVFAFVLILLQQVVKGTRDWPLFMFIFIVFTTLAALAMAVIIYGYMINSNEEDVQTMLSGEEQYLSWIGNDERKEKVRSLRYFITVRQQTDPVEVMYLPASSQLISAFLGVLFSGILIVIQITTNAVG